MVREAVIEDIPQINELGRLLHRKFEQLFVMEEIMKDPLSKVYVYEKDGRVVGFLDLIEIYESADINNIVVAKEERGKNIASILLDYAIDGLNPEVALLTLEVAVDNEEALGLYKKFGFDIIRERPSYYDTKNAYVMGKKLIR